MKIWFPIETMMLVLLLGVSPTNGLAQVHSYEGTTKGAVVTITTPQEIKIQTNIDEGPWSRSKTSTRPSVFVLATSGKDDETSRSLEAAAEKVRNILEDNSVDVISKMYHLNSLTLDHPISLQLMTISENLLTMYCLNMRSLQLSVFPAMVG